MKYFLSILLWLLYSVSGAQNLTIGTNSKLIMHGPVSLVVRNAALINNGYLADSAGTLQFSGHRDSSISFLNGTSSTSVYNLSINKNGTGTALKSETAVQNVLGVYGGTLYPDSNLTLRSDANLTARVDVIPAGAGIVGKAMVERFYASRRAWRLVTSPLTSTTSIFDSWQNKGVFTTGINTSVTGPNPGGAAGNGLDASPMNNSSMKTWNYATQQLDAVLDTKLPLSRGNNGSADNTGYFLFVRGDRNYNNFFLPNTNNTTLSSNGQLQVGAQHFTAANTSGAFTLIGNPYASPIDFNTVTRINLVKRFYVWDPALNVVGAYVMLDDLDNDGVYTKSINASAQTNHLQSSQAFFVETQANGAAGINFQEADKSPGNNNALFRPSTGTGNGISGSMRFSLFFKNDNDSLVLADGALLECGPRFSDEVNRDDALKFSNINENMALFRYGRSLSAERRPELTDNDTLFFRMNHLAARNYTLQVEPSLGGSGNLSAWLEDNYLNSSTSLPLQQISGTEFSVDGNAASAAADRFRIVFKQPAVLPVTIVSIDAYQDQQSAVIQWVVNNELNIRQYLVEHSSDGIHFFVIDSTRADDISTQHSYAATDPVPVTGINFYRIRYIDQSGQSVYTRVVSLRFSKSLQPSIAVFPNPVKNNSIHLECTNLVPGKYQLQLFDAGGQLQYSSPLRVHQNLSTDVVPGFKLPAGNYLLSLSDGGAQHFWVKVTVAK